MNRFRLTALCTLLLAASAASAQRITATVNDAWRFSLHASAASACETAETDETDETAETDETCETADCDDTGWEVVSIPHTWNALDTDDETPGYARGKGRYRRRVRIEELLPDQRVTLRFDGANQRSVLYVNGRRVGSHTGGYTAFAFDITEFVRTGENLFVVEVDNAHDPDIPPLSADYTFYGGIYRDVSLVYTPAVHIATTHYATDGVYVRTDRIEGTRARIAFETRLTNRTPRPAKVLLEQRIADREGRIVARTSRRLTLPPSVENHPVEQTAELDDVHRWDTEDPYLYRVYTSLTSDAGSDEVLSPLGVRTYRFDPDRGFFLNDRHVKLIGTNRHQDYLKRGNALTDEMHERDVELLRAMGGNFLRVSHYPQDPVVMEMCDRAGILSSVEIPIINAVTRSDAFRENCRRMAIEMVRQNFNHPSVVVWAYMNEVLLWPPYDPADAADKADYYRRLYDIARTLEETLRSEDPARYTMLPCHSAHEGYVESGIAALPQLLGFNIYDGWYRETFAHFGRRLDRLHALFPHQTLVVSEYGADVDPRIQSFAPERYDFSCEYGNLYHESYLPAILERDFVAASSIWNLNDFYSEGRGEAVPHVNNKGVTGLDRTPKDSYYLYRATLTEEPVLHICTSNRRQRCGTPRQRMKLYTNAPEVAITLNGTPLGRYAVRDRVAEFDVELRTGENRIAAVGEAFGQRVEGLYVCRYRDPSDCSFEGFSSLNVLLGTNRSFEDPVQGALWVPEQPYRAGSWGYVGGKVYRTLIRRGSVPASDAEILGTENDPIYQTRREGIEEFRADVPDGAYTISLHFAELNTLEPRPGPVYTLGNEALHRTPEPHVFDIEINGRKVADALDIASEYGSLRAVCRKFDVTGRDGEGLRSRFRPRKGEAAVNAVRIYRKY